MRRPILRGRRRRSIRGAPISPTAAGTVLTSRSATDLRRFTGTCCTTARTRPHRRTPPPDSGRLHRDALGVSQHLGERGGQDLAGVPRVRKGVSRVQSHLRAVIVVLPVGNYDDHGPSPTRLQRVDREPGAVRRGHRQRLHHRWHQPDSGQESRHELPAPQSHPSRSRRCPGAGQIQHFLPAHDPGRLQRALRAGQRPGAVRSQALPRAFKVTVCGTGREQAVARPARSPKQRRRRLPRSAPPLSSNETDVNTPPAPTTTGKSASTRTARSKPGTTR